MDVGKSLAADSSHTSSGQDASDSSELLSETMNIPTPLQTKGKRQSKKGELLPEA